MGWPTIMKQFYTSKNPRDNPAKVKAKTFHQSIIRSGQSAAAKALYMSKVS